MSQNIFKIYDGRTNFWQWDTKQKLIVLDDCITEVRFSNRDMEHSKPVTDDVNIFLHWEPKTYTVTLMSDGEVWQTISVQYLSAHRAMATRAR